MLEILVILDLIDPSNVFGQSGSCAPLTTVPAWWSAFVFQTLNGRQVSLYLYLSMLMGERNICHPTTLEIRRDLGLLSATMVFESMNVLERYGFILRSRRSVDYLGSRRNVYQRPSCRFTIIRLLDHGRIDGNLRPTPYALPVAQEAEALIRAGIEDLLGERIQQYDATPDSEKAQALINLLGDAG